MIKAFARHRKYSWIGVVLLCGAGTASAQWWGTNAAPCSNHNCAPTTTFGYVPTRWHQWPGAVYPDMARPTPAGEEIPPSRVEVPPQSRELEIQSPTTQPPARSGAPESGEPLPMPGMQSLPSRPTEEPSEPSFRATPEGGPSIQQSPFGPQGGSSSSLRNRLRGVAFEGFAAAGEMKDPRAGRSQSAERKDTSSLIIASPRNARINTWMNSPDQEPELIVPSLASRPLAAEPVGTASERSSAGNPLRTEPAGAGLSGRGVVPAVALDTDRSAGEADRAELGTMSASARTNPLR